MGATSKCYALIVVMICALCITVGSMINVITIAAIPSCIPQRMQPTIFKIVEEIGEIVLEIVEKVPQREMPALVWIILLDLLIILSAMVPKMTFDQRKFFFEGMESWYEVAFLTSFTVSF